MTKVSKNLNKHIKLLKQETNRLEAMKLNGETIDKDTINDYLTHKRYVEQQLKVEKFKAFNDALTGFNNL